MPVQFRLSRQGQEYGPYEREQLEAMMSNGELLQDDLVWCEGMSQWELASNIFKKSTAKNSSTNQVESTFPSSRAQKKLSLVSAIKGAPLVAKIGGGVSLLAVATVVVFALSGGFTSPQEKFFAKVRTFPGRSLGDSQDTIGKDLNYDVKKSDSVVSPYEATLSGTMFDAGEKDPEKQQVVSFTAKFAYQNRKWTVGADNIEIEMVQSSGTRAADEFNSFASMARNAIDNGSANEFEIAAYAQLAKEKRQAAEQAQSMDALARLAAQAQLLQFLQEQFDNTPTGIFSNSSNIQ
jgi:hypothetical protein